MKTVLNPDLPVLQDDWWFQNLSDGRQHQAPDEPISHARMTARGELWLCRSCFAHIDVMRDEERTTFFNHAVDIVCDLIDLLGISMGTTCEIWQSRSGLWHRIEGADELVHSPFIGRAPTRSSKRMRMRVRTKDRRSAARASLR